MGKEMTEAQEMALFAEAERVIGSNADDLVKMAMLAFNNRRVPGAQRVLSFKFGRNSRLLARAVTRWPEWFMPVDGAPARAAEPDELLALFTIAGMPKEASDDMYANWRRYSWRAWKIREEVDKWRKDQRDPRRLALRHKKTLVEDLQPGPSPNTTRLVLLLEGEPKPKARWRGKSVVVELEELRDAG